MKKLLVFFVFAGFLQLNAQIQTPAPSPLCKLDQKIGLGNITIEYSRPGIKNRKVFGGLVPYGEMWRTGANSCTKISFSDDVMVGDAGSKLAKGTYALLSVPGETDWEIIFYNDVSFGGLPKPYDQTKEVLRLKVGAELIPYTFESLTFDINDIRPEAATLNLIWENTLVPIKLKFEIDSKVVKQIDKVLAGPTSDDYYTAARYYYDSSKDLTNAIGWIQKANQMDPQFWKLRMESLIMARAGRKAEAIEAAQKSKKMAMDAGNNEYVKMNEESIAEWSK